MKDKPNSLLEEDTEEMTKWRGMNQEEMDQSWKYLEEKWRKRFWSSTRCKREACRGRRWNGSVYDEASSTRYESGEKIAGKEPSLCSESTTCSVGRAYMKIPRKKNK